MERIYSVLLNGSPEARLPRSANCFLSQISHGATVQKEVLLKMGYCSDPNDLYNFSYL